MSNKDSEKEELDIEKALERLDEINSLLARGDISLKESIELYTEGVALSDKAGKTLEGVEKQIKILSGEEEV